MLKKVATALVVFAVALALRVAGDRSVGPFDDAYHLKRIASFPHTIQLDRERDAWCPWPPGYDFAMGAIGAAGSVVLPSLGDAGEPLPNLRAVAWVAPVGFAIFAAALAWFFGPVTGIAVALSPYLIDIAHAGSLDHHWLETILAASLLCVAAGFTPPWWTGGGLKPAATQAILGAIMIAALFTQTALILACGLTFIVLWMRDIRAPLPFAATAVAIVIWRIAVPYPNTAWFLGWPHAALMTAAAVALALKPRWYALPIGAAATLPFLPQIAEGFSFFRVDPWLASIAEFQPMFRDPAAIGTDFANLGGAALALVFARKRWNAALPFAIVYVLLALTSRRFLVVAIVAVLLASLERTWIAIALTIVPPLAYDGWAAMHPEKQDQTAEVIADDIERLPPGRVLAPWHLGHAIDVLGRHAVVIDNFGSMPDEMRFTTANDALIQTHAAQLVSYCKRNGIAYLALDAPAHIAAAAQCAGIRDYPRTRLAPRTVWMRLLRGEAVPGFTRVAPHVWQCSTSISTSPSRR